MRHPTTCAWLGTGGSVGQAGVQGGRQGWRVPGTGKLPCRLSARARGRRSLPRAVCSGSVPRGAGTTSNRAEPGRCLREGTGMLTVPPGAGHPQRHSAWPTWVASSTRDHPVTDAGAQGMLAWGLSAVHVPLSPLPCAQGCTLRASTGLSVSTIACPCIACLPMGRLRWVDSRLGTLGPCPRSVSPSVPSTPWQCHLIVLWVLLLGGLQAGCFPWAPSPCSAGTPAEWGSQVPGPSASPCCHRAMRCQGCHHHWVTPVGERGETVGLDPGTWDCCVLPVPVG